MKFFDKTRFLLLVFIFLWASIGLSITRFGWESTWEFLHIPAASPIFADMRTIQGSLISIERGYNPQLRNPGDPWHRVMNYPSIWITIANLFRLDNEANFLLFEFIWIFAYLLSCFWLLRDFPHLYLVATMFSGAALLAVERGNNDLIVFILLLTAVYTAQNSIKVFAFFLSVVLKIYPVFAILIFSKRPKLFFFGALTALTYFFNIKSEMKIIQSGNTAQGNLSYGLINVFKWIATNGFSDGWKIACIGLAILLSFLLLIIFVQQTRILPIKHQEYKTELFITGGSIFTFTYLITFHSLKWF